MAHAIFVVIMCNLCAAMTQHAHVLSLVDGEYDVNEWPGHDQQQPTNVSVQMYFNSFGSLNAANMDFTIDIFLRQSWTDSRLQYAGGLESYTIFDPKLQQKIWKPDTYFENVKEAAFHHVTMPNTLLRIDRDGNVLYTIRVTLRMSCNMQLELFPFDAQICGVRISTYANTDDRIAYNWRSNDPMEMEDDLQISQFDLIEQGIKTHKNILTTGNFSGLTANFHLRRQYGYHMLQTYIPTILIVSISWVSFWLDPTAVPARVTLGLTTLLTLTTLANGIRQGLPPVSYVKAIDVWVGTCMFMVFGALMEFTLVNRLANKKIHPNSRVRQLPKFLSPPDPVEDPIDQKASPPPTTYILYGRAFDKIARYFVPGGFLVFNLIYWPYYIILQRLVHLEQDS